MTHATDSGKMTRLTEVTVGSGSSPPIPAESEAERRSSGASASGEWKSLLEPVLLFLFPPCCRCCGTPLDRDDGIRICDTCWRKVELIQGDVCPRCGHPLSDLNPERGGYCGECPRRPVHFDSARSAARYDGAIRSLVHALKFRYHTQVASFLSELLVPTAEEHFHGKVDVLTPVPLHWMRFRWREFNQSALLAEGLGTRVGVAVETGLLRRVRRTKPQSRTAGRSAKRRNVRGAFRATRGEPLTGRKVLLVDDIYTSGSTVNECARILKEAGAGEVHVITVARLLKGD